MVYVLEVVHIGVFLSLVVKLTFQRHCFCFMAGNPQLSVLKKGGVSGTEAEDTGDDELLESAFRSASKATPRQPRTERKRSQYRHRKSCK